MAAPFVSLRFGNAILSRYPIVEAKRVAYPGFRAWETMLAGHKEGAVATIALPGGRRVRVVGVHLEHRGEPVRIASAELIAALADDAATPLIAAGDFNSTRKDLPRAQPVDGVTAISLLLEEHDWRTRRAEGLLTFPAVAADREIDWILATPGCRVGDIEICGGQLSDHRGIVATVSLPEGER